MRDDQKDSDAIWAEGFAAGRADAGDQAYTEGFQDGVASMREHLSAVRTLHQKVRTHYYRDVYLEVCKQDDEKWPCATVRALDGSNSDRGEA